MDLFENNENTIVFVVKEEKQNLKDLLFNNRISGRFSKQLFRGKTIYVNGKPCKRNNRLKKGDVVSIKLEDEREETQPEPIPLDIIYEDMDLLILNKQPFIVVHETKSHRGNTIANGISHYFKAKGINRKIRFINRLDMNTSGILLVAKSSFAHQQMALQLENREVEKRYLVMVSGIVKADKGRIDLPIGREEKGSPKKAIILEGKKAISKYRVIDRFKEASLLDVQIITGRSHQIRVHLNHIGHPVIGDTLYYKASEYISRQALHSYYLKARLPRDRQVKEFLAPMPKDFVELTNHLRD